MQLQCCLLLTSTLKVLMIQLLLLCDPRLQDTVKEETGPPQCCVCFERARNTALGCGHVLCGECASRVEECPLCRTPVTIRIKLYL